MNAASDEERGPGWYDDPLTPDDMRWYMEGSRAVGESTHRSLESVIDEVYEGLWAEVGAIARTYLDVEGLTELDGVLIGIARRLAAAGVSRWPRGSKSG